MPQPSVAALPRLTTTQVSNTLVDIFGPDVPSDTAAAPRALLSNSDAISAAVSTVTDSAAADQLADFAFAIAAWVFDEQSRRDAIGVCTPMAIDDACIRTSIIRAGQRLWRRPLSTQENDGLVALTRTLEAELGSADESLEHVFASILMSPHFVYRVEVGEPASDRPEWLQYTDWEMASRLSFALWQSAPDQALFDAAEAGELGTVEQIRAQAERMLADPRASRAIDYYLRDYFHFAELEELVKSEPAWTPELRDDLIEEFRRVAHAVVEGDRDYAELFTSTTTFVNASLASFYGVPFPSDAVATDFVEVALPAERRGILTMGSILARYGADSVNPVHRGRFIRTALLCQPLAEPPASLTREIQEQSQAPRQDTTVTVSRDRAQQRLSTSPCNACHAMMDPIGLGFEQFDAIGAFQAQQDGVTATADGWLDVPSQSMPAYFDGAPELAELLTQDARFIDCAVRNMYERLVARPLAQGGGELAFIEELSADFQTSGRRFRKLLSDIVASDGFRYASTPEP